MGSCKSTEIEASDYFAFDKYMGILGVLMIKGKYPIERVQQILLQRLVLSKYTHCEVG